MFFKLFLLETFALSRVHLLKEVTTIFNKFLLKLKKSIISFQKSKRNHKSKNLGNICDLFKAFLFIHWHVYWKCAQDLFIGIPIHFTLYFRKSMSLF